MHCKILCLYFSPKTMTILIKKILTVGHSTYVIIRPALLQIDKSSEFYCTLYRMKLASKEQVSEHCKTSSWAYFHFVFFAYVYVSFSVSRISYAVFMSFSWKAL